MSAPGQNPRPAPVTTMAPTSGAATAWAKQSKYARCSGGVHAFIRSGRFSVTMATPSSTRYSASSAIGADAKPCGYRWLRPAPPAPHVDGYHRPGRPPLDVLRVLGHQQVEGPL